MTDTVDKVIIQSSTQGVQQTTSEVKDLSKAMDGVTVASEKVERSTVSAEGKFASLERRYGTSAAASRQYEKELETINTALAQNPSLAGRAAELQAAMATRFTKTGEAAGLARYELINLGRQVQDIGVSLFSGQSPLTVGVQQGSQIFDVFASSGVRVKDALGQVAGIAGRVITSTAAITTAVVGAGAAAIYFANKWDEAAGEVDRALTGIGGRFGTTAKDISDFASANSRATGLSITEARNAALEFAKTGTVQVQSLKGVGEAIHGYAVLTGKDATEATKAFTDALNGDLYKGIESLDKRYASLNARSLEYIRTLVEQGDKTKALQVFIDASAAANRRAEESVGFLSKAWEGFKNIASNITSGPAPKSLQEQLNNAISQRDTAASSVSPIARQNLARLQATVDDLQKRLDEFNADNASANLNVLSKAAAAATSAILPQIDAIHNLNEAIGSMDRAQASGAQLPAYFNDARVAAEHLLQQQKESLSATVRQATAVQQLQALWGGVSARTAVILTNLQGQLAVASAITGQAQMMAQQQATINNLLAQDVSLEEATAIAAGQAAIAQASATTAVLQQVQALRDQNAMIKATQNGTEATTAASIAYRNAIASGADETAAAALKAETLKNYMLQAASAADAMAASLEAADQAAYDAYFSARKHGGDPFGQTTAFGPQDSTQFESTSNTGYAYWLAAQRMPNTSQIINSSLSRGVNSAISTLSGTTLSTGPRGGPSWNSLGFNFGSQGDITGAISQLFDLKLAQAGDNKNAKLSTLQEELAWLQTQPMTISNMRSIVDLTRSIRDLQNSTDELTDVQKASLNPLYSEGHGALKIGYYKAATGLEGIVQGPAGVDNVPVHMMLTAGESLKVTPAGQSAANNNGKVVNVSNTFNIVGPQSVNRRSMRQAAQGFGQAMASLS